MAKRRKDPFAAREAKKYKKPIPSREFILEWLTERNKPTALEHIAKGLGLHDEVAIEALRRRLQAMRRDGQLLQNRRKAYCLLSHVQLISGIVLGHRDGYGFVTPDEGGTDIFLPANQMRSVFDGDRVLVRIIKVQRNDRKEGQLVEILERNTQQIVGRFYSTKGVARVEPENKNIKHNIFVPPELNLGAKDGDVVMVQLETYPTLAGVPAVGRVVEVLGEHMDPGMEIDIAKRVYGLPFAWPAAVNKQVETLPKKVTTRARAGREDLRALPFVTIDGADARDFDDAVYCERRRDGGWRLWVAIADVSHYVKKDSAIDVEAHARATSVYFPQHVLPMLPEILSNELCSLKPKVDRLTLTVMMQINAKGDMTRYQFKPAVIHSHFRLTYTEVASLIKGDDAKLAKRYHSWLPQLDALHSLYKQLHKQRQRRGAIEFETLETQFDIGEDKKIKAIRPIVRHDAHRLIEECMILANVAAAKFLSKHHMPALYRNHDVPDPDRIVDVQQFLKTRGLVLSKHEKPTPLDYCQLLKKARNRDDYFVIQTMLLRALKQAVYGAKNIGHFGLSLDAYTHFTSPIRRYPDLLVHRAIYHILEGGTAATFAYQKGDMIKLGQHCSFCERRADEATRDAVAWLKCEFMSSYVGTEFSAMVTGVTSFGIFVQLKEFFVDGLVHVSALENDYYIFNERQLKLIGERSGKTYTIGDLCQVRLVRVSLDDRQMDFELITATATGNGRTTAKRRKVTSKSKRSKQSTKPSVRSLKKKRRKKR